MFFGDEKKAMSTVIAKRGSKGERTMDAMPMKDEISKNEDGSMDGRHAAMQDFMSAHREGSAQKMMEAMANFIDIHNSMPHGSEGDKPDVE